MAPAFSEQLREDVISHEHGNMSAFGHVRLAFDPMTGVLSSRVPTKMRKSLKSLSDAQDAGAYTTYKRMTEPVTTCLEMLKDARGFQRRTRT